MPIKQRSAVLFIFYYLVSFYSWLFLFADNRSMLNIGACSFPLVGVAVSTAWLFRAYQRATGEQRKFWLLLSIGAVFYYSANIAWFWVQVILGESEYPKMGHVMWLSSYVFFMAALIYKLRSLKKSATNRTFIYNLFIFMVASVSFSTHYLIYPMINFSSYSFINKTVNLSYPVADLVILFIAIHIYYLSSSTKEKKFLRILSYGFFIQVFADTVYAYLLNKGLYQPGSYIDPLWMFSILVMGLSSFHVSNPKEEVYWVRNHLMETDDGFILNLSVFFLTVLVVESNHWQWNVLVIGLTLTIHLIVVRQVIIMKKNRELMNKLWYQAYHDPLTGLNNRASFQSDLQEIMDKAKTNQTKAAILLLDLDHFKNINDTMGHDIGDLLLQKVAQSLTNSVGQYDRVYRIGGDEFILILPNATEEYCTDTSKRILNQFTQPLWLQDYEILITPSIGISLYPDNGDNSESLLKNADTSMYLAKNRGRNSFEFYSSELNEQILRKKKLESELNKAIKNKQFTLCYQPKVDLISRDIVGMEALLRWEHPELGFISPSEFIPIAEETGLIISIGEWVLKTACRQLKEWHQQGLINLCVSINVSVRQFQQSEFKKIVERNLLEVGLEAQYLELEIKESIMQNIDDSIRILEQLKSMGVKISIDDFGMGYSSLYLLQKLPIDGIKIDRAFIEDSSSEINKTIIKAIIEVGLKLNFSIVIEGIESEEQITDLLVSDQHRLLGQGYLFGKPMTAENIDWETSTFRIP